MEFAIATAAATAVNLGISLLSDKGDKGKKDDIDITSSYDFPIEQPYGRYRMNSRILFWGVTPMEEIEEDVEGGKGGNRTQIKYLATFAVITCWKTLAAYNRIWFGKELVYNSSPNATEKTRKKSEKFFNNHLELYYGTATQLPSPTIEEYEGIGNVNAMRHVSYIVIKDYPVSTNSFPTVDLEVTRGDPPAESKAILDEDTVSTDTLEFIICDVSSKVGIEPSQLEFDTYMQNQLVNGTVFKQDGSSPQPFIEELQKIYFFFADYQGDKIFWKHKSTVSDPIIQITEQDLRARETGAEIPDPYQEILVDEREIPSELWLGYVNPDKDYDLSNQPAWNERANHRKKESIRTAVAIHDTAASEIVWKIQAELIEQARKYEKISLLPSLGQQINVGGLVTIPIKGQDTLIQVSKKAVGTNDLYEIFGEIYNEHYLISNVQNNHYPQSEVYTIPEGEVIALDIPLIKDGDLDFGIYLGVKSDDKWNLGSIYASSDNGSTYSKVTDFTGRVTAGVVTQLPDVVDPNFVDYGS
ncbi:MAG: phage tail protein, partial [Xenococcus sp. (in: cyanobacteria)]